MMDMSVLKERRAKLFEWLRSGKYGKCQSKLAAPGNTRCVWGVAMELAAAEGWVDEIPALDTYDWGYTFKGEMYETMPPDEIVEAFLGKSGGPRYNGLGDVDGSVHFMASAMVGANDDAYYEETEGGWSKGHFRTLDDLADVFERWEKEGAFTSEQTMRRLKDELDHAAEH